MSGSGIGSISQANPRLGILHKVLDEYQTVHLKSRGVGVFYYWLTLIEDRILYIIDHVLFSFPTFRSYL